MKIKQSVLNTFNRIGLDYTLYPTDDKRIVYNRFGYGSCETSSLIAACIHWVYNVNPYLLGTKIRISDFDRVRYFVLEQDRNAYNVCLD